VKYDGWKINSLKKYSTSLTTKAGEKTPFVWISSTTFLSFASSDSLITELLTFEWRYFTTSYLFISKASSSGVWWNLSTAPIFAPFSSTKYLTILRWPWEAAKCNAVLLS